MIVTNISIYNYYLKNREFPVTPGSSIEVDDAIWESDDQLARTIESLDNYNLVAVSERPVNYPRTREFPSVVNIIADQNANSLPEQWTKDDHGGIEATVDDPASTVLAIKAPPSPTNSPFYVEMDNTLQVIYVTTEGELYTNAIGGSAWWLTLYGAVLNAGMLRMTVPGEPSDGDMFPGEMALSLDPTNGATKLKIKAKQNDGTVVRGEVSLS